MGAHFKLASRYGHEPDWLQSLSQLHTQHALPDRRTCTHKVSLGSPKAVSHFLPAVLSAVVAVLERACVHDQKPVACTRCVSAAHGVRRPEDGHKPPLHQRGGDRAEPRPAVLTDCCVVTFNPDVALQHDVMGDEQQHETLTHEMRPFNGDMRQGQVFI